MLEKDVIKATITNEKESGRDPTCVYQAYTPTTFLQLLVNILFEGKITANGDEKYPQLGIHRLSKTLCIAFYL